MEGFSVAVRHVHGRAIRLCIMLVVDLQNFDPTTLLFSKGISQTLGIAVLPREHSADTRL